LSYPILEPMQGAYFPSFGHETIGGYTTKSVTEASAVSNLQLDGTKLYRLVTEAHRCK